MKRNLLIGGIAAVILVAAVAIFGWKSSTASAATTTSPQTVTVQRGTIVATVNAAGNVSAPGQASIAFQSSGRVAQVAVQIGDTVKQGQLLMQLDTTDLALALKTAQTNLAGAQAAYDASQVTLQYAVKTAQANLAGAQANYDGAKITNSQNPNQLIVAKAALDKAVAALQQAQAAYDKIGGASLPGIGMTSQSLALQQASIDYQTALGNYNITAAGINDNALKSAQAALDNAQTALDQAKSNLDTSTRTAQATLDNAKAAVDQAQRNLDNATIYAPFDGVVSAVNYSAGDSAGSSTAVTVTDLSNLQVKVTVAEVDMAKLKVGDTAQMTLDALPGRTFQAQVLAIGPVGTITSGVVNYPVTVQIAHADNSVKPGMTANLAVTVDQRTDVLLVPSRAIRTQGNQKLATVLADGQTKTVPVKTGLSNDTSVEVTSGLQAGDVVVVNQTQPRAPAAGGGFGIPGLGRGG